MWFSCLFPVSEGYSKNYDLGKDSSVENVLEWVGPAGRKASKVREPEPNYSRGTKGLRPKYEHVVVACGSRLSLRSPRDIFFLYK